MNRLSTCSIDPSRWTLHHSLRLVAECTEKPDLRRRPRTAQRLLQASEASKDKRDACKGTMGPKTPMVLLSQTLWPVHVGFKKHKLRAARTKIGDGESALSRVVCHNGQQRCDSISGTLASRQEDTLSCIPQWSVKYGWSFGTWMEPAVCLMANRGVTPLVSKISAIVYNLVGKWP